MENASFFCFFLYDMLKFISEVTYFEQKKMSSCRNPTAAQNVILQNCTNSRKFIDNYIWESYVVILLVKEANKVVTSHSLLLFRAYEIPCLKKRHASQTFAREVF